jgi:hypothetical protein
MQSADIIAGLSAHIPAAAIQYCAELWRKYPFRLRLSKSRVTKAGDFTCRNGQFIISLNRDLNPYLFLVTYIHEVAHRVVYEHYGNRCRAHGPEWKQTFQELMNPLLTTACFPEKLLPLLRKHMVNPRASCFSDVKLTGCFMEYDQQPQGLVLLSSLPENTLFQLRSRCFIKGHARRTRFACRDTSTRGLYLIPGQAWVRIVQLPLFTLS